MNAPPNTLTNLAVRVDDQARRLGIHEYQRLLSPDTYNAELHETDCEVMRAVLQQLEVAVARRVAELFPIEEVVQFPPCDHEWVLEVGIPGSSQRCVKCGRRECE